MDDSLFLNFFFSANFHSPTGYDLSSNNLKSCLSVKKKWSDSFLFSNKIKQSFADRLGAILMREGQNARKNLCAKNRKQN